MKLFPNQKYCHIPFCCRANASLATKKKVTIGLVSYVSLTCKYLCRSGHVLYVQRLTDHDGGFQCHVADQKKIINWSRLYQTVRQLHVLHLFGRICASQIVTTIGRNVFPIVLAISHMYEIILIFQTC